MKNLAPSFLWLLATTLFFACQQDQPLSSRPDSTQHGLTLLSGPNPGWHYQNMRIYPIVAEAGALDNQTSVKNLTTLAEAMTMPGFRITEQKQFGRSEREWYNGVTVQNKTRDTIYLLSGDVVTGGNQDRVMAYDEVILPATVNNVEVFCVEKGRSHYYDESAPAAEKQVAAFKGYFSVASPRVRQAVQRTGSQSDVWAAVDHVTAANNASSATHTYAGLATENDKKAIRDAYLQHYAAQFADLPNLVGMVVVAGGEVLGVDMFGHPDLYKRQSAALLHGYVAEAVLANGPATDVTPNSAFTKVARLAVATSASTKEAGKFSRHGVWVHLYSK